MARKLRSDSTLVFDYKDVKTLMRFINSYGQIEPIGKTSLTDKQQRSLAVAIKRARHLAPDGTMARIQVSDQQRLRLLP